MRYAYQKGNQVQIAPKSPTLRGILARRAMQFPGFIGPSFRPIWVDDYNKGRKGKKKGTTKGTIKRPEGEVFSSLTTPDVRPWQGYFHFYDIKRIDSYSHFQLSRWIHHIPRTLEQGKREREREGALRKRAVKTRDCAWALPYEFSFFFSRHCLPSEGNLTGAGKRHLHATSTTTLRLVVDPSFL